MWSVRRPLTVCMQATKGVMAPSGRKIPPSVVLCRPLWSIHRPLTVYMHLTKGVMSFSERIIPLYARCHATLRDQYAAFH